MGKVSDNVKKISRSLGSAAAGEIIGRFISLLIPDSYVTDEIIAHGVAALFGIAGLIPWSRFFPETPTDYHEQIPTVRRQLLEADRLFRDGLINASEHIGMRHAILQRNQIELKTPQVNEPKALLNSSP